MKLHNWMQPIYYMMQMYESLLGQIQDPSLPGGRGALTFYVLMGSSIWFDK